MAKTLEAHDKLIREIFEGSYQFEIPDYQRPYAWTTEQATDLFDDLYSAMQDERVSGASSQYFLGSIVLIKNDRNPKSSVVDGQQRLSTHHDAVSRVAHRNAGSGRRHHRLPLQEGQGQSWREKRISPDRPRGRCRLLPHQYPGSWRHRTAGRQYGQAGRPSPPLPRKCNAAARQSQDSVTSTGRGTPVTA